MSTVATHADCTVRKVELDLKSDILSHFSYTWSIHSCRCWSCAASERTDRSEASPHNLNLLSHLKILSFALTSHHHTSPLTPHYHTYLVTLTFHHSLAPFILHPHSLITSHSLIPSPITSLSFIHPLTLTHHLSPLTLIPHLALSHIIHPIHSPSTILIVHKHEALLTILVALMLTPNVPV